MKFSYNYKIYDHDVDINGIASVSALMRFIQQTASQQHVAYGPQIKEIRDMGMGFILSRAALDINGILRSQDEITVTTWLNNARGFGFTRYTQIDKNGENIAKMSAFWGIIDLNSRRPLKVEDVPLGFGTDEDTLTLEAPTRFRPSKDTAFTELGSHRVLYPDCDENVHLNNTNYPSIFCSYLPTMEGKKVTRFSINYLHEARLGTSFKIFGAEENGAYLFKTELENDENGADARLVLEDI